MSLFHALSSYLSLEYRRSVVKASILEPGESKLFLERVQNKLTPLILGSKECRMKGRGSKGWKRVSRVKEEELRCKNKRRWIYIRADSDRAEKLLDWQDSASSSQLHSLARSSSSSSISSTAFFHHFFFLSKMFSLSLSLSLFERYHFPIPPPFSLISHRSRLSTLLAVDSRFFVRSPTTYLPLFDDPCFCGTRFSSDASLSALIVAN